MGNKKSKNSDKKININNENYNNQQIKTVQNEYENEKEEDYEIIIEIEISNNEKEKEINILCDKDELIEDNEADEYYYKENDINPPIEFNYFNKNNTKLYLNDKEIEFNYKLKFDKIGIYKIKIISNINLFSLPSMFYNCNYINKIKFIKINTNNVNNMSYMFYNCVSLKNLDVNNFDTNNVTEMGDMFEGCKINIDRNKFKNL